MALEPAIKSALQYACQVLKEKTKQALEANVPQVSLPSEVTNLLKLPQRSNRSLLKALFGTLVGSGAKEPALTSALVSAIEQSNPKLVPGLPLPQGNVTPAEVLHIRQEVQKELLKKRQKQVQQRKEEMEDEALMVVDDAAGNESDDEDIYETYRAAMVEGDKHPDPIVETSSLASVKPPKPTYNHHLQRIVEKGQLSDAQMETIVYANMRFQAQVEGGATAGFFLGDGAGVGKGRQIAALILEHSLTRGKRCLWVSVSNDLRYDAVRDLKDVDAGHIQVHPQGTGSMPKKNWDSLYRKGVLFITYSLLIQGTKGMTDLQPATAGNSEQEVDTSIPAGSRLKQVVEWLKGDKAPLIVLDECHKAKNLVALGGKSTQTGKAILKLQMNLPKAKVLYSSATGASEPNNLAYMIRLGACGYKNMSELVSELNGSGLGSLEMFSMGLKATGSYVSRALSYQGAEFQIAKVKMDPVFRIMYNRSCQYWHLLYSILKALPKPGRRTNALFFAAQQRFFRQMLMAAKVPDTAKLALDAVAEGMCVVIGLQSTGEANTNQVRETMGDTMEDFVSAPRQIMQAFLEDFFPTKSMGLDNNEIDQLRVMVYMAIQQWRTVLPAKEQARKDALNKITVLHATSNDKESDDDEPTAVETLSLDEVIARQTEEAKRSGRYIDLTAYPDETIAADMKQARVAMKQEEAAEAAEKLREDQEKVNKEKDKIFEELDEAEENVKTAKKELQETRAALEACNRQLQDSSASNTSGKKRLRKVSGVSDHSALVFNDAEDSDSPPTRKPRQAAIFESNDDNDCKMDTDAAPLHKKVSSSVIILDSSDDEGEQVTSPVKASDTSGQKSLTLSVQGIDVPAAQVKEEDAACTVCGKRDWGSEMLLCDGCDAQGALHLTCLDPPLHHLPEGDWFCPACTAKRSYQDVSQESTCTTCNSSENQEMMVTCSTCRSGPRHAGCLQPPLEAVPLQGFTCSACMTAQENRLPHAFATGKRPNRGGLQLKEKAAVHRLQAAEDALKALQQRHGRALRAAGRGSRQRRPIASSSRAAFTSSDASGSEMEVDDTCTSSDSDFCVLEEKSSPKKKDVKPKIKKAAEYKHATAREELTNNWEHDVDAMPTNGSEEDHPVMVRIRNMLLRLWSSFELPANPLDQLTELMGGADAVAEMTGRKGQLVRDEDDGMVHWQQRRADETQKMVNMREKGAFMVGEKLIAIISDAASTGISLQADKRVKNQRRRCHLTLELPWSADKAIQQFGRSHRSNQASAPVYRIIVTECAGEFRFAASAAKRLQSLGALLKGDRRALGAGQDLKEFDCDNKWGQQALKRIIDDTMGNNSVMPGVKVPEVPASARTPGVDYSRPDAFYEYIKPRMAEVGMVSCHTTHGGYTSWKEDNKVCAKVSQWLNRVLAMNLEDQELLFRYFSDTHDAVILAARSRGEYDQGIQSVQATSVTLDKQEVIHTDTFSDAKTYHTILQVDRGCAWESALEYRNIFIQEMRDEGRAPSAKSGFYIDRKKHGKDEMPYVVLATEHRKMWRGSFRQFRIQRPNIGSCPQMQEADLTDNYTRVNDARAEKMWKYWFDFSGRYCMHGSTCSRVKRGGDCRWGMRVQPMHLISGAVLPVLKHLYTIAHNSDYGRSREGKKSNPKVFRAKLNNGEVIVGMELHPGDAQLLMESLEQGNLPRLGNAGMPLEIPYLQ